MLVYSNKIAFVLSKRWEMVLGNCGPPHLSLLSFHKYLLLLYLHMKKLIMKHQSYSTSTNTHSNVTPNVNSTPYPQYEEEGGTTIIQFRRLGTNRQRQVKNIQFFRIAMF